MSPRPTDYLRQFREEARETDGDLGDLTRSLSDLQDMIDSNRGKVFGEVFSSKELREYNKGLGDVRRNIRVMQQEYRRMTDEVSRLNEEMDDISKKAGREAIPKSMQRYAQGLDFSRRMYGAEISRGEAQEQRFAAYQASQEEARTRRNRAKLAVAVALGGAKGYALARILQGVNIRQGQQAAALGAEGALGVDRGVFGAGLAGMRYGINPVTGLGVVRQTGQALGRFDRASALSNMLLMQGRGLNIGDITGFQKSARIAGDRNLGKAINETLVGSFKASGANPALMEEFLRGATSILQRMSGGSTSYTARDAAGTLALMSARLGGVYQRAPERTAGLIGRLSQGIQAGGSDALQGFKLRAVGFGSGRSYYQSIKELQKGATPQNIMRFIGQIRRETPGSSLQEQAMMLYSVMGGSGLTAGAIQMHEAETLMRMRGGLDVDTIQAWMDARGLSRRVGRRTGDVRRTLARQQAMANLAGTKGVQTALNTLAAGDIVAMKAFTGAINTATDVVTRFTQAIKDASSAPRGSMSRDLSEAWQDARLLFGKSAKKQGGRRNQ